MSRISWEDLVFENRNQSYGAYNIRKKYGHTVVMAFAIASTALAIVMAFPTIKGFFEEEAAAAAPLKAVKYTDLAPPPPIDKDVVIPPKIELPPPVKDLVKFIPPKVVDKEVVDQDVPTMDALKKLDPSTQKTDGDSMVVFSDEPVPEVSQDPVDDPGKVWTTVEQPPEFPGGVAALMKFIAQNTKYPAAARRMGTEGSVFVSFVVGPDGKITDVQTIKGIAADCDRESMRVIQSMPPWKPGKQNGKAVRVRFVLPVKFVLST
jgi:periplasmic protein TonB